MCQLCPFHTGKQHALSRLALQVVTLCIEHLLSPEKHQKKCHLISFNMELEMFSSST